VTNKTDRHDIAEMLLKVALNTIPITYHTLKSNICFVYVVLSPPVSPINKTDRHDITENNISAISWRSVLLVVEETGVDWTTYTKQMSLFNI
jgi:hypothetical protein